MGKGQLEVFFYPESIAIVGASRNPSKAGYQIVKNLIQRGYKGEIYPVNPSIPDIEGLSCYPSLKSINNKVELVVIAIPAPGVLDVMREAVERKDIRGVIVVSAGFAETKKPEDIAREEELVRLARLAGIRVFGPNCTGVINTEIGLDTTIEPTGEQLRGGISIYSQSGAMGGSILLFMEDQPVPLGFNKWAHTGNTCDINVLDVLSYYGEDDSTKTVLLYVEAIDRGRDFLDIASQVSARKPILALKVGKTDLGAKAAYSHTGALAGSDRVYEAAFAKTGVIRVQGLEEMIDTAKALTMQPLPKGNRICILTEAGGPGTIAMDEIGSWGEAILAEISEKGRNELTRVLPPMAIICQPQGYIDITAAAMEQHHYDALRIVLAEDQVDGIILISVPPTFLHPESLAQAIIEAAHGSQKPILTCLLAGKWVKSARKMLEEAGLPTFDTPERAARAMVNMVRRWRYLSQHCKGGLS